MRCYPMKKSNSKPFGKSAEGVVNFQMYPNPANDIVVRKFVTLAPEIRQ